MKNLAFSMLFATMAFPFFAQLSGQRNGKTIGSLEQPRQIRKKSETVPVNEWYTIDKKTLFYHGEETKINEICPELVSEIDGAFRIHDTTVNFETDDFTVDAPVWYLSNGSTLICINKKGYGRGMLMLKPT